MNRVILLVASITQLRPLREESYAVGISFACVQLRRDTGRSEFLRAVGGARCNFATALRVLAASACVLWLLWPL